MNLCRCYIAAHASVGTEPVNTRAMTIAKSVVLFALAAVAEIGGAWLVWQAVREGRAWWWAVATFQPDANFGHILAAYGGVFVAGSLVWAMAMDGFRPDQWDLWGAAICLVGVASSCSHPARPDSWLGGFQAQQEVGIWLRKRPATRRRLSAMVR